MNVHRIDAHEKQVRIWETENAKGLSKEQLVPLFAKAILAVEKRSLVTLSSVTVMVVADRAIHESKEKHPILANIKIDPNGMDFSELLKMNNSQVAEEACDALRYLLMEYLMVLGNITAQILTTALHRELMMVTGEGAPALSPKKTNRDEK